MNKIPQAIISFMFGITTNRFLLLLMINILLFIIGMLVNDATGMVLAAPLLLPLVKELGITPVQFAAIMGTNLAMGGVTPPYASILYLGMRVGKVEFLDILKPTLVFILFGYVPVVLLNVPVDRLNAPPIVMSAALPLNVPSDCVQDAGVIATAAPWVKVPV